MSDPYPHQRYATSVNPIGHDYVEPDPPGRSPRKVVAGVVGAAFLLFVGFGIGKAGEPTPNGASPIVTETAATVTKTASAVTKTVKAPPAVETKTVSPVPKRSFDDGAWLVGRDIKAGTYTTTKEVGGTCYWERRNPKKDGFAGIIANNNVTGGFPTVTLKTGEEFKSQDCGSWRAA